MEGKKSDPVPITKLPVQKLQEILKQIETRCGNFADAIAQLNGAVARYDDLRTSLESLQKARGDSQLLVPVTDSLFVSGSVDANDSVLVDVGTGFYVEKSLPDALQFVERRKEFVRKQVVELEGQLDAETRNMEQVALVLEAKLTGQLPQ